MGPQGGPSHPGPVWLLITMTTCPAPCQVLMSNIFHFCLLMPGLVFSLCALNVVTDSMLTKAVSASDTGECGTPGLVRGGSWGDPGPPLWEACWAVSGGAAVLISGWVCADPVGAELGGRPGVQVGGMGVVGRKSPQVRILPTTQPSWAPPALHQALLTSPGPGPRDGSRASGRWHLTGF